VTPASLQKQSLTAIIQKVLTRLRRLLVLVVALVVVAPAAARADQQTLTFDVPNTHVSLQDALVGLQPADIPKAGPTGLRMWVILPDGYTAQKCWPVLYLLHGSGTPNEWTGSQALVKGLNAIVVVPGGGDSQYSNWWNGGKRAPQWESWFFDDVMGVVAKNFPICADRASHAIAGTSMGGAGALYLASQRPGYFGAAGAFSGIPIDLGSPIIQLGFNQFGQVWGPAGGFYAQGHDDRQLVGNLRHTRVFMGLGDGNPYDATDVDPGQGHIVEVVAGLQAASYAPAARKAGVKVTVQKHVGIHTPRNFEDSLARMLRWNPFAAVTEHPKSWTLTTVARTGDAWGYKYRLAAPPTGLVRFTFKSGALVVDGTGRMTLSPPEGGRVTARLPFSLRDGTVRRLSGSHGTVTGGKVKLPVSLGLSPWHPKRRQAITVRFRTDRALKADETYQVIARQQTTTCFVTDGVRVRAARKKQLVTVKLAPGTTQGHPAGQWCRGNGHVHVLIVPRASTGIQLGDYLGTATFRVDRRSRTPPAARPSPPGARGRAAGSAGSSRPRPRRRASPRCRGRRGADPARRR
jgi:S-formylglutathione hydrolase FrmB